MNKEHDEINPRALKMERRRRHMTQQQLADEIKRHAKGCTKDTVSRWERGKIKNVRMAYRRALCKVLRVKWETLAQPPDKERNKPSLEKKVKIGIDSSTNNAGLLVAHRYGVSIKDVINLAPLMFLIVAELNLQRRNRKINEIYESIDKMNDELKFNCAHLDKVFIRPTIDAEDQLDDELDSLEKNDLLGHEFTRQEPREGPFIQFIREQIQNFQDEALCSIESSDGIMISNYEIATDTLREITGLDSDGGEDQTIISYLHSGLIDLEECLLVKNSRSDREYRAWLSDDCKRIDEAFKRLLESLDFNNDNCSETNLEDGTHV